MSDSPQPAPSFREAVAEMRLKIARARYQSRREAGYGFALRHAPARVSDDPGDPSTVDSFWVVTAQGESLHLTHRMLDELEDVPLWIYGQVPAIVHRPAKSALSRRDDLVESFSLTLAITGAGVDDIDCVDLSCPLTPLRTLFSTLVILTRERPEGWPP